jgi:hypothetical protein
VAGVGKDRSILHRLEVLSVKHVDVACDRDEDVAIARGLVHLHDPEPVHGRLECLHRVDLGDDDVRAMTLGP